MADKPQLEGLKSAADVAKQIIALSTGVIAITVTFLEKIVQPGSATTAREVPRLLKFAWGGYGLSILFACITLMAITGTFTAFDRRANGLPLNEQQERAVTGYEGHIRMPAGAMVFAFLGSLLLTILVGVTWL